LFTECWVAEGLADVGQAGVRLRQREIVMATTNVPGPTAAVVRDETPTHGDHPYVPIATTMRTGISIFTYCGTRH